jgi:GNAT superfamily N-acetyltransferase
VIVTRLTETQLDASIEGLADLLVDTVDGGASVGFLAPLDRAAAVAWWKGRAATSAAGQFAVWTAQDGDRTVGTVGLTFPDKPNSRHRAELVKLMVHRDARGRGLGRRLLAVAEEAAVEAGVTLLHLDTETGSPAEYLYRSAGWTVAGVIPDYAADPSGLLRPTTLYYKYVGARSGASAGALTR